MPTPLTHLEPIALAEATLDEKAAPRTLRNAILLQAGLTRNGARLYPEETVRVAASLFENAKLWCGHGNAEERQGRTERNLRDWVGHVRGVRYDEATGRLIGDLILFDEGRHPAADLIFGILRDPLARGTIGLSWEGTGTVSQSAVEGQSVARVDHIDEVRGEAFVPEANAGGRLTEGNASGNGASGAMGASDGEPEGSGPEGAGLSGSGLSGSGLPGSGLSGSGLKPAVCCEEADSGLQPTGAPLAEAVLSISEGDFARLLDARPELLAVAEGHPLCRARRLIEESDLPAAAKRLAAELVAPGSEDPVGEARRRVHELRSAIAEGARVAAPGAGFGGSLNGYARRGEGSRLPAGPRGDRELAETALGPVQGALRAKLSG
jgi:hypothetical protein